MASTSGVSGIGQVAIPADPAVLTLFSAGVVGMSIKNVFDSILSDEEEDDGNEQMSDGAGLMDEDGGDDLGGLGGFEEGDDEFGEFGDDEFGDMDSGPDTDELEHRLDELETEVGSLSSTVNTVRNENEQISETVDEVEENVRKLLDIYEMVTRGVNPFADDIEGGGLGGAGDGDSFGLFDNGQQDDGGDDELDEDIANADAEGFFDDDLVEDDEEGFGESVEDVMGEDELEDSGDPFEEEFDDDALGEDEFDDDFDDGGFEDDFDDGGFEEDTADDDGGSGGGKSFQELKDEYESGEADWADEETGTDDGSADETLEEDLGGATAAGDDAFEDTGDGALDDTEDIGVEDGDVAGDGLEDELADDELFDTVIEDDEGTAAEADTDEATVEADDADTAEATPFEAGEPSADDHDTAGSTGGEPTATDEPAETDAQANNAATTETEATASGGEQTEATASGGKPYLATMPEGYGSELIVIEWLEYLVGQVGIRSTAEAIDYYERIDWVSESVADSLQDYLRGFDDDGSGGDLTIDHHTRSLKYIGQLNGTPQVERMGVSGGGSDGLQR
ncbi:FlaD/FlaE family flagellar protein [Halapricum hydrolyticum]